MRDILLLLLSLALCCYLTQAQRPDRAPPPPPPPPREHNHHRAPPPPPPPQREQDIVFPDPRQADEERREFILYKIQDFLFENMENLPRPRPPPPMGPHRPGQPFPPPPNSRRHKKRKTRTRRRLCERKYSEYIERIFPNDTAIAEDANDEDFDGRILAKPGEYPHMAALGFQQDSEKIQYKCGGSLISENFVLSAAHCTDEQGVSPKWVRIGGLNLLVDETSGTSQIIGIQTIHNYPSYKDTSYYHDIALLKLERKVKLTEFVRPIRLWVTEEIPTSIAFAMGYGSTSLTKSMTNRLTHLNLTIVPNDECNRDLPAFAETPDGIIASQICAQDFILSRDTCQGDSGGPLQLNLPGRRRRHIHYHLIGITSYGVFCRSSFPSVYTRVFTYLDWIEQMTWGTSG
ncbi:LOW QUALITY PROTEIN: serine protease snake [Drosophila nasuta]|uniref:LOW QUALITY PROTEIN: serine protease snake n=1 Tax=Drosophila nasuta TaxID=42062 RepID=UPI00295E34EE|nr:LOW QUALITY PROTEIN: serine protease snake [Drosophila nasuta]